MALSTGIFSTSFLCAKTAPFRSSPSLRVSPHPANLRLVRAVTSATAASSSEPSTTKVREPRGIMKPRPVSPEMQDVVGEPVIPRTQALKRIWAYIKERDLQDPQDKKVIICDEKLKKIFAGKDRVGFLEIAKLIGPHFL
ncbi:SWIB/MDM2 domain superfamily protein [Raphanus sativus]|uniref:Upstream activation factor subunit UAF30 n=1 Tax=Raphanus sativus TaxID=3726 RepID=A0A6J0L1F4_RAPSA|nr:upstream activation factor subunit UAF30 [Raphanus sativus]XP_056859845.1 upstream activation factor subunit UAF30 [Raphanus sativus]KAJ4867140.1 SWIB/MDM2 domain superfamily protein [Raphanus sativus]KAJ4914271.1 SWIB/MDM2 domain superfamily protein [Raphanus sativus]